MLGISCEAYSQDSAGKKHSKTKEAINAKLKEMADKLKKINPFKKKDASEQPAVKDEPKKSEPAPPPLPPPRPDNTKAKKTTTTRKKGKTSKPATDNKSKTTPII